MALTQTGKYIEDIYKLLGQYVDALKRQTANNLNSETVTAEGFLVILCFDTRLESRMNGILPECKTGQTLDEIF